MIFLPIDQLCMIPSTYATRANLAIPIELQNETYSGSLIMMTYLTDYSGASIPTLLIEVNYC